MKKGFKFIFSLILIFGFSHFADAQITRVYNEQQLIMLEQQGLLYQVEEKQISEKAKDSNIYKKYKGLKVEDPRFRKRKNCKKKKS